MAVTTEAGQLTGVILPEESLFIVRHADRLVLDKEQNDILLVGGSLYLFEKAEAVCSG